MSTNTIEAISKPVTITEFIEFRRRLADAKDALSRVSALGLTAPEVKQYVTDLTSQPVQVLVPCALCKREFTTDMMLSDSGVPRTGVCENCDDRITLEVISARDAEKLPNRDQLITEWNQNGKSYLKLSRKYGVPVEIVFRKVKGDIGLN